VDLPPIHGVDETERVKDLTEPGNDKTWTFVPLIAGTMVSHYRIVEKIGSGGMGKVHLAEVVKSAEGLLRGIGQ